MSRRNSNTSVTGMIILGAGLGIFIEKTHPANPWWVFVLVGLIIFIIGLTKWGGGE
jgi:F0F1-type ATP synthase assembly protein I